MDKVIKRYLRRLEKTWLGVPVLLWYVMAAYVVVLVVLSVLQFSWFAYEGFDLGIFDQVLWNTSQGRWFEYSFNPHSYIVDHRSWLLLLLVPVYWAAPHPITLLVIQTLVIALGAIPLFILIKKIFYKQGERAQLIAVLFSLVYLLHPSIWAMNLFEFHMLPFVMPLVFILFLKITARPINWLQVYLLAGIILLLRDDLSLMMVGVGLLMSGYYWKRFKWHGLVISVISAVWFAVMIGLGIKLSNGAPSKFMLLYDWMGSGVVEMAGFILTQPGEVFRTAFSFDHINFLLMTFALFGFLPLLRLRYLLPAVLPMILYLLADTVIADSVLFSHLAAVFLPWFFISTAFGLRIILNGESKLFNLLRKFKFTQEDSRLLIIVTALVFAASIFVAKAPLQNLPVTFARANQLDLTELRDIIAEIPEGDSIMVSRRMWPYLTQREEIYSMLHLMRGTQHFTNVPYIAPAKVDWLILEYEMLAWAEQTTEPSNFAGVLDRLEKVVQDNDMEIYRATQDILVYRTVK